MNECKSDTRCRVIMNRIARVCDYILRPVLSEPVFFMLMVLLGSSAPLSVQFFAGKSVFHYILYAVSTCALEAYILCLILLFIKWRPIKTAIKVVVYLYVGLFAMLMVGTGVLLKSPFNVDILGLIAETDVREAGGFFKAFMNVKSFLLLAATVLVIIIMVLVVRRVSRLSSPSVCMRIPVAILLMCILGYGAKTAVYMARGFATPYSLRRNIAQPGRPDLKFGFQALFADPLFKSIDIAEEYSLNYSDIAGWEELQPLAMKETLDADTARNFSIAIIIGESFIRSHSSLYGYPLPTNPRLGEELASGRLILFGDMTSPANMTTESVRNTLNLNDISSGEKWCEGIYFPSLLKRAGWNVYHYDNQTVNKSSDVGIAGVFYSDFVMEHVLDGKSDRTFPYDMEYVEYTEQQLSRRKSGKTFVIYHLLGQHFPASMRYEGSPRFTPGDIVAPGLDDDDRQLVADYDNATLYNDSVVARIIRRWSDECAVVVYFSDHGEDLPDLGGVDGRIVTSPDDEAWIERQFHVPFMVWTSESFMREYPRLRSSIEEAAQRPGTTDRLGHMILGLCGIKSCYYQADRDQASLQYRSKPRKSAGGYDLEVQP